MLLKTVNVKDDHVYAILADIKTPVRGLKIPKNFPVLYLYNKISVSFGMLIENEPFYKCLIRNQIVWINEAFLDLLPELLVKLEGEKHDDWP